MFEYEVLTSGSKGNSVVINNVMVDCGTSYKTIKDMLFYVDYLLITHKHGDHVNKKTYQTLRKKFPNIVVIANQEVADFLNGDVDYIMTLDEPLKVGEYQFSAFRCVHDVLTFGYYWSWTDSESNEDIDIIYATDTQDYRFAPRDKKFDYLFLESNHDENKLNAIKKTGRKKYGYDAYGNGKRHASTQVCKGYYYMHRKEKDSKLIELHKSERFY